MKKMKKLSFLLPIISVSIILSGCASWIDKGQSVTSVGPAALQPLVEAAIDEFRTANIGETVNVQGGGSGTGLSQVQPGAIQVGDSGVFAEEEDSIDADQLIDHQIAAAGLTIIINDNVKAGNLTTGQPRKIFTGEIIDRKEVDDRDLEISTINRAASSGSCAISDSVTMDGESTVQSQEQDPNGVVKSTVSQIPGAISYLASTYVDDSVKTISLSDYEPTAENVTINNWPLWSYEHMYARDEPADSTKEFLSYIMSDEVQKSIVEQMGYISVSGMQATKSTDDAVAEK